MEIRTIIYSVLLLSLVVVTGCNTNQSFSSQWLRAEQAVAEREAAYTNGMCWPSSVSSNETVMVFGMKISAHSNGDGIIIQAGHGFERSYTWDGNTRTAKLWPRAGRWYGNQGIYFPGSGEHWKSNGGITRGVLQEGVLWFKTLSDTTNWLRNIQPLKNYAHTGNGLVVAWERIPERKQINVDIWQLMIGGQKPESLPGSSDEQVNVTQSMR
jgi:hypothetical protein